MDGDRSMRVFLLFNNDRVKSNGDYNESYCKYEI